MLRTACLLACTALALAGAETYQWRNLRFGGGGAIPSLVVHPKVRDLVYLTTDVGGCDRWDEATQTWTPLWQWLGRENDAGNLYGIAALAVDPTEDAGNRVYVAAGGTAWNGRRLGGVWLSTDRGATWTQAPNHSVPVAANWEQPYTQRLVVDPHNPDLLYHASRTGLYRCGNIRGAADSWSALPAPTPYLADGTRNETGGYLLVAIDPAAGTVPNPTRSRRIIACYHDPGDRAPRMVESLDGGVTFAPVAGLPGMGRRAVFHGGTLYLSSTGGLHTWSGGRWTSITPAAGAYIAFAIDPHDPRRMVAAQHYWGFFNPVYRSTDGGATWSTFSQTDTFVPDWYETSHARSSVFCLAFDPFTPGRLWYSDWYMPWRTENAWATPVAWTSRTAGHEELVCVGRGVLALPSGPTRVLSCVADEGGMLSGDDPAAWPRQVWNRGAADGLRSGLNLTGADYAQQDPLRIAVVGIFGWNGDTGSSGGWSTDGGLTWTRFPAGAAPGYGGRCAVSADGATIVWANDNGVFWAPAPGTTWTKATGIAASGVTSYIFSYDNALCADRVDAQRFYLYRNENGGRIYRSTDQGRTWAALTSTGLNGSSEHRLVAEPTGVGRLWLSAGGALKRSVDGGVTWTAIATASAVKQVGLGVGPTAGTVSVYIYGRVGGAPGYWRSDDAGASWVDIDVPDPLPGNVDNGNGCNIAGDWREHGRVYVSTTGNGVFVGRRQAANRAPAVGAGASAAPAMLVLP